LVTTSVLEPGKFSIRRSRNATLWGSNQWRSSNEDPDLARAAAGGHAAQHLEDASHANLGRHLRRRALRVGDLEEVEAKRQVVDEGWVEAE
jgi:hypothetical protein